MKIMLVMLAVKVVVEGFDDHQQEGKMVLAGIDDSLLLAPAWLYHSPFRAISASNTLFNQKTQSEA